MSIQFRKMATLLVCSDTDTRHNVRQALVALGFSDVTSASSHSIGVTRVKSKKFDLILFDAKASTIPTPDFVEEARQRNKDSTLIALSSEPRIDDVFGLLRFGTHGFVVLPLSSDVLEAEIERAQSGAPLNKHILDAPDRNTAFSGMLLTQLDRIAALMRQSRKYQSAERELPDKMALLEESVYLAKLFAEGGEDTLLEYLKEEFIKRVDRPATRLGRARKRLDKQREFKFSTLYQSDSQQELLTRITKAKTLEELGESRDDAIGMILAILDSGSVKERLEAVKLCAKLKIQDSVLGLSNMLGEKEESLRCNAAAALAIFGPAAKFSIPHLKKSLEDQAFAVRRNAAVALGRIGPAAADSATEIAELLFDWHPEVRMGAVQALGNLGPLAASVSGSLIKVLDDEEAPLRGAAAQSLGEMRAQDAVSELSKKLGDSDSDVRTAVSQALRKIGTPGALSAIRQHDDEDGVWSDRRTV